MRRRCFCVSCFACRVVRPDRKCDRRFREQQLYDTNLTSSLSAHHRRRQEANEARARRSFACDIYQRHRDAGSITTRIDADQRQTTDRQQTRRASSTILPAPAAMTAETSSAAPAAPVDKVSDASAAVEGAKPAAEAGAAATAPRESAKASSSEGAPSSDRADDAQEAVLLPDKVELPARSAKPAQAVEQSKAPQGGLSVADCIKFVGCRRLTTPPYARSQTDENTRRKREREGSVEPTASQSVSDS